MSVPPGVKFVALLTVAALLPWAVIILAEALRWYAYEYGLALLAALFVSLPLTVKQAGRLKHTWQRILVMLLGTNFLFFIFVCVLFALVALLSSKSSS